MIKALYVELQWLVGIGLSVAVHCHSTAAVRDVLVANASLSVCKTDALSWHYRLAAPVHSYRTLDPLFSSGSSLPFTATAWFVH